VFQRIVKREVGKKKKTGRAPPLLFCTASRQKGKKEKRKGGKALLSVPTPPFPHPRPGPRKKKEGKGKKKKGGKGILSTLSFSSLRAGTFWERIKKKGGHTRGKNLSTPRIFFDRQ